MGILEGLGLAGFAGKLVAIGGILLALFLARLGIRHGAKREERAKAKAEDTKLRAEASEASHEAYLEEKSKAGAGGVADLVRRRLRKRGGPSS